MVPRTLRWLPDTYGFDGPNEGHLASSDGSRRRRFDALFEAHRLDVASYCTWRTASRSDAEDAVAEVFVVAWRRIASAQAAEQSGTVSIEVTQDGALWGARTVRWNGSDISITNDDPGRAGRSDLMVVGGTLYGPDPESDGGWLDLGSPANVDPDSGTTPDEYLTTVRADAGGDTFRRITGAMTDLTTTPGDDGSVVYSGTVAAGVLAPETGTKEGMPIRVLPYGYVAHDDASDPAAPVEVRITVRADDTIEEIHATWGGASSWSYRLSFSDLGSTPAPTAPANARSLCVERGVPCPPSVETPGA